MYGFAGNTALMTWIKVLVEKLNIQSISTPEADLKAVLVQKMKS